KNPFRVGERLYLRPLEVEDVPLVERWINDPEVNRYLAISWPMNAVREREWIEGLYKEWGSSVFLVVLKEGDRPIGNCGLHFDRADFPNRCAELGIMIGEKEFQDCGYGGEAMRLLCDYGFNRLNLRRIGLRVYAYNRRAIRCYEKAGFRAEGSLREARFLDGQWYDVVIMGLLDREFRGENAGPGRVLCQQD
ncbi:MAG: GNAT family N-acetyltransferase, partial [Planctomycetes bacterium]|nr:GNAT family N-acetyltransferase [Planctomycetota bacterium]